MTESRVNDLMGTNAVDFEGRVDMIRLKKERLTRLREQMSAADLGGVILFDPLNIRYATGYRTCGVAAIRMFFQYAVIPLAGEPQVVGIESDGSNALEKGILWDFFPCGQHVEESSAIWGQRIKSMLTEMGIADTRIGVDKLDYYSMTALQTQSITIADARVPVEKARSIKTVDEVSLIRQSCAVADIAICAVRDAIEPGVTEDELFAIMTYENLRHGGEHMDVRLLATGTNTNPWNHLSTDRMVRPGELVAFDTDMCGPMGYFADFSRTYLCGDGRPNDEQREAYKIAYDFIYESLDLFQPAPGSRRSQKSVRSCPKSTSISVTR